MEKIDAIMSLDLGTSSIHGVIAKINSENKIEIMSADTYTSDGVKNGVISDISAAEFTVKKFFTKAEEEFKVENKNGKNIIRIDKYGKVGEYICKHYWWCVNDGEF